MPHYLNNCQNRDHVDLFGEDAFYDLDTTGPQASLKPDIRAGDYCVVVSQPDSENLRFSWFKFTSFRYATDKSGKNCQVFSGTFEKSEQVPRAGAPQHKYYRPFFDKNGHFKRQSVL